MWYRNGMRTRFDRTLTYEDLALKRIEWLERVHGGKGRPDRERLIRATVLQTSNETKRHLVNFVRHEMTDYEDELRAAAPKDRARVRNELHRYYLTEIYSAYPFLRPEEDRS
jgi:hypothetical protein